jgi:hypothetical protein
MREYWNTERLHPKERKHVDKVAEEKLAHSEEEPSLEEGSV